MDSFDPHPSTIRHYHCHPLSPSSSRWGTEQLDELPRVPPLAVGEYQNWYSHPTSTLTLFIHLPFACCSASHWSLSLQTTCPSWWNSPSFACSVSSVSQHSVSLYWARVSVFLFASLCLYLLSSLICSFFEQIHIKHLFHGTCHQMVGISAV